ncbi:phage terminase small subunit P27 family [Granulicella cerasi]|uniref:Phage terminase small subunit P27 family n=1 Tax=Granulicella cerasi TaxID=741063 RepID=A0ABW1Z4U9_9BACT|nr:phage terminase small subunit P27 family [Granulicella cerasi]
MAGRKPKPTIIKQLSGNPGKRRLNKSEPSFSAGATCPKHLDKVAKAEWKRIAADLTTSGLLTSVDRSALAAYCVAFSRWIKAEELLEREGLVIVSPKSGYAMPHPAVSISNTAMTLMHKFASEFGFTPSSRSRINVAAPTKTKADPLDAFFDLNTNDDEGLRQ